eukprot:Seg2171.1 transcript_id=Seg2171.1/GoldUCD/mRNA.D3Y31 product="hypothetical protein" protein_id=Seg2171.1/GoldUCD/D3Y31
MASRLCCCKRQVKDLNTPVFLHVRGVGAQEKERRYSQIEKECLAFHMECVRSSDYILGKPIVGETIITVAASSDDTTPCAFHPRYQEIQDQPTECDYDRK